MVVNYPLSRQQIAAERAQRIATYKQMTAAARQAALLRKPDAPLNLLADGDSWFDYPLGGTIPLVSRTDIIAQLPDQCTLPQNILNLAHYGDATTTELGLQRTQQIIGAIAENGPFDAILFSGGGNDVVGDPFCIWLNDAASVGNNPAFALDPKRFNGVLGVIQASYLDLIALRNEHLPNAPIFVHGYDFANPSGQRACPTVGPWLKPALDFCGWTDPAAAKQIVHDALTQLGTKFANLAADPQNKMVYVQTQGVLAENQWANELHPTPDGFKLMARAFRAALAAYPPFRGRI